MNNYPNARVSAWVVKSLAPAGLYTHELGPGQLGIFDPSTYKSVTDASLLREAFVAIGSYNVPRNASGVYGIKDPFNTGESYKSEIFNKVAFFQAQNPQDQKPFIGYYGYNGTNPDCGGLGFTCGKNYIFEVRATGRVIEDTYGQTEVAERYHVETDCCDPCDESCTATELSCKKYVDKLVAKMNHPRSRFARFANFYTVSECGTTIPPVTYPATIWCLELCDAGDNAALSEVRGQYGNINGEIVRTKREGNTSTYSVCLDGTSAPADFLIKKQNILAECGTCSDPNQTLVPGGFMYVITIDNDNTDLDPAAWLSQVQSNFPTATKATKTGFQFGTSTYNVVLSAEFTGPLPIDTTISGVLGTVADYCVEDSNTEIKWEQCGTATKYERTLCVTFKLPDCNTGQNSIITEMNDFYGTNYGVVAGSVTLVSASKCMMTASIRQISTNCAGEGCDWNEAPVFNITIPGWEGQSWNECPCTVAPEDTDCVCGIKVEGKIFGCTPDTCINIPNSFKEYDLPIFQILRIDESNDMCVLDDPMWVAAQLPEQKTLDGHRILKEVLETRIDRMEFTPAFETLDWQLIFQNEGIVFGVEKCEQYALVSYTVDHLKNSVGSTNHSAELTTLKLYSASPTVRDEVVNLLSTFISNPYKGPSVTLI